VSGTAEVLDISRSTVRRARDGELEEQSRRPQHSPTKTEHAMEELIVTEAKRTGFKYRRLAASLKRKYSIRYHPFQICSSVPSIKALKQIDCQEMPPGFCHLPQGQVPQFYGIGCVDCFTNCRGISE